MLQPYTLFLKDRSHKSEIKQKQNSALCWSENSRTPNRKQFSVIQLVFYNFCSNLSVCDLEIPILLHWYIIKRASRDLPNLTFKPEAQPCQLYQPCYVSWKDTNAHWVPVLVMSFLADLTDCWGNNTEHKLPARHCCHVPWEFPDLILLVEAVAAGSAFSMEVFTWSEAILHVVTYHLHECQDVVSHIISHTVKGLTNFTMKIPAFASSQIFPNVSLFITKIPNNGNCIFKKYFNLERCLYFIWVCQDHFHRRTHLVRLQSTVL